MRRFPTSLLTFSALVGSLSGNPHMVGTLIGASRGDQFKPSARTKRSRWKRARAAGRNPGGWARR